MTELSLDALEQDETDLVEKLREAAKALHAAWIDDAELSLDCALPAYLNEAADVIAAARAKPDPRPAGGEVEQ